MSPFSRREALFLAVLAATVALYTGGNRLYFQLSDSPDWSHFLPSLEPSQKIVSPSKGTGETHTEQGKKSGPVNLNRASLEDLMRLPGIGPALAGRILAFRSQRGRFTKIEELMEVEGIGPIRYMKIKGLVEVK